MDIAVLWECCSPRALTICSLTTSAAFLQYWSLTMGLESRLTDCLLVSSLLFPCFIIFFGQLQLAPLLLLYFVFPLRPWLFYSLVSMGFTSLRAVRVSSPAFDIIDLGWGPFQLRLCTD